MLLCNNFNNKLNRHTYGRRYTRRTNFTSTWIKVILLSLDTKELWGVSKNIKVGNLSITPSITQFQNKNKSKGFKVKRKPIRHSK